MVGNTLLMPMLQTAGITVRSRRRPFNRPRSTSPFSLFAERLPSPDTNAVTDSFYSKGLGPPFVPHLSPPDRLVPYCLFPLLIWHLTPSTPLRLASYCCSLCCVPEGLSYLRLPHTLFYFDRLSSMSSARLLRTILPRDLISPFRLA
jgi:hypothetical protein